VILRVSWKDSKKKNFCPNHSWQQNNEGGGGESVLLGHMKKKNLLHSTRPESRGVIGECSVREALSCAQQMGLHFKHLPLANLPTLNFVRPRLVTMRTSQSRILPGGRVMGIGTHCTFHRNEKKKHTHTHTHTTCSTVYVVWATSAKCDVQQAGWSMN
jgi:hypothetical protein